MEDKLSTLNPKKYWDDKAKEKTFTHPLMINELEKMINQHSNIVDYGCGYGRIVNELNALVYNQVSGFDISSELIYRGKMNGIPHLSNLSSSLDLPLQDQTVDCFILFAVLTCIPLNNDQQDLINLLYSKLKLGGIIYISDYYLQSNSIEVERYETINDDLLNLGVFKVEDDISFRHHTKEWIQNLFNKFEIIKEWNVPVKTMKGNDAEAFQMILRK